MTERELDSICPRGPTPKIRCTADGEPEEKSNCSLLVCTWPQLEQTGQTLLFL